MGETTPLDSAGTWGTPPARRVSRRSLLQGSLLGAAGLAASGLLTACDSAPSTGGATTGGKARVRLWHWYSQQRDQWGPLIEEFQAAHPTIVVENRLFGDPDSYLPALQGAVAAGDPPEIFAPHVLAIEYGKAGVSADLRTELGADFLKDFFKSANDEYTDAGKQYALGWMAQTFGIFYDPDILARAKVDVPETWDDLLAAGRKINDIGVLPCLLSNNPGTNGLDFFLPLITQASDDPALLLDIDQQRNGATWENPKVVEALTTMDKLVKGGAFAPNSNGLTTAQGESLLYTGKAAMLFMGSWVPQDFIQSAPKAFVERYKVMPTPAWAAGKRHWCANQAGAGFAVSRNSPNKAAALEFVKFMYEPARYAKIMNDSASMPSTQTAGRQVADPVLKQMTSWLLNGDGAPHILFGKGSSAAAANAVAALVGGQAAPEQTSKKIQTDVVRARGGN
ncbi:ABC transporter substrate-binding protein [Nonomuraea sp. M3C6]|uniref:ABC transporter substrate-binding protein n=1 Tax=Nonomuraea marmarensis TaxID=3351344 RepID=A0ABW7AP61_9ACTN